MNRFGMAVSAMALWATFLVGPSVEAKQYIIKYRTSSGWMHLGDHNMEFLDQHHEGKLVKVDIPDKSRIQTLAKLFSNPSVEYIVPNFKLRAYLNPINLNPTALRSQWAMAKVEAEKAWKRAGNKGSKKIVVAVIDTGVDYRHSALAPNMVQGYDFKNQNNDPMDKTSFQNPGHGTHCAGVVGATGQANQGTIGLSPDVSIMPLRFLDENGSGDLMDGIKAIDYAIANHANVISASWGAPVSRKEAEPLIEAVERAGKAGIPFVVAAANDGKNNDTAEYYPTNAGTENTISVSATDSSDGKPSWSNYGRARVSVSAPGEGIISTLPKDKYGELSGTSMATPLVAGLVALIKAQDPNLSSSEIRSLIQATGDKVNVAVACDCRVNAFNAIDAMLGKKMFVSPNAATIAKGDSLQFSAVYGKAPFQYSVSNSQIASIDATGMLKGVSEGDTTVTVTDARGQTAQSYKIYVGSPKSPTDPTDPGGGGQCPFDPATCQLLCQFQPDLEFCK